jgi:hypothetical protein
MNLTGSLYYSLYGGLARRKAPTYIGQHRDTQKNADIPPFVEWNWNLRSQCWIRRQLLASYEKQGILLVLISPCIITIMLLSAILPCCVLDLAIA